MDHVVVYLVPVGVGRYELYAEAPDHDEPDKTPPGWFGRLSARAVRLALATVGDQRTLWALRNVQSATLVHPAGMSDAESAAIRDRLLARAARHHAIWLGVCAVLLPPTILLAIIPGPNIVGYYFAARGVGHYFSWRGAKRGSAARWDTRGEPALTELGGLAELPREARASRVEDVAARLKLSSLAAFFDRTAEPARS